ncbi:MmgE/PrpD family protein [Rhodococcus sp. NPDC059968]|uniref:MmgE/PrpD family protein n=1 Tax=Rhodococcus sp. NPDC059968 TaxID=3347017 RepID=UPI00366D8B79
MCHRHNEEIRKRMLKQHEVAADTLIGSAAYTLASYATATKYETLPGEVADRAKLIVFDQLACGFVGAELPAGRIIGRYVDDLGGRPQSVVLGSPNRCSAPLAALANGTSGHADEFDSVHATSDFLGTGHPAAIIVPAAAALAERQFCTGRDLVNAVALGYDVGARVISVTGGLAPMMGNHGIDPGSLHSLGAAFACARLLGLDENRHLFAAALAVQQSVALNAPYGERRHMSKAFVTGQAAYAGVTGAVLAATGFEASDNIFEAPGGIIDTWAEQGREGQLAKDLGADYAVMGANFKFYSAGYPIHSPVEAVLGLKSEHGFALDDIERITVRMPSHPASVVDNRSMPTICLQHMVAAALVAGKLGFDEAHSAALLNDPEVLRLKSLVALIGDAEFDRIQPQGRGAEVTIEVGGGSVSRRVEHPRGHRFRTPAPAWDDLREKWEDLLVRRVGQGRFDQFFQACASLESVDDVNEVSGLLGVGGSS